MTISNLQNYGVTMKKYPDIELQEIIICIKEIGKSKFNTHDFIDLWCIKYPKSYNNFTSIGVGWKGVVGKNLSKNAGKFSSYVMLDGRENGAQLWQKY